MRRFLKRAAMSHGTLFRVRTADLRDPSIAPRVEAYGPKPQTDGIAMTSSTARSAFSAAIANCTRSCATRASAGSTASLGADGWLYMTDIDLPDIMLSTKRADREARTVLDLARAHSMIA